ncbi:MAG: hypothetical protein KAG14_05200 [Mycoplasmataceae bacterium]|nr:hypothetical protein [Mycoplasmataceae bacterium]
MNIFLFFFTMVVFNVSVLADIDGVILSAYENMYGPVSANGNRDHHCVWDNLMLKFPGISILLYSRSLVEAEKKFIAHKNKISGYVNEYDDLQFLGINPSISEYNFFTRNYGDQQVYSEMKFFGILLVESYLEIEKNIANEYKFILFMLAFHRQMMAQYMSVNEDSIASRDKHSFGYVKENHGLENIDALRFNTQMFFQYPEACKFIIHNIKEDHDKFDADEESFHFPEGVTFTRETIYIKKILFKHDDGIWPLSRIYIPKESKERQVFSNEDSTWLMVCSRLVYMIASESVVVQHGEGMICDIPDFKKLSVFQVIYLNHYPLLTIR